MKSLGYEQLSTTEIYLEKVFEIEDMKNSPDLIKNNSTPTSNSCMFT